MASQVYRVFKLDFYRRSELLQSNISFMLYFRYLLPGGTFSEGWIKPDGLKKMKEHRTLFRRRKSLSLDPSNSGFSKSDYRNVVLQMSVTA